MVNNKVIVNEEREKMPTMNTMSIVCMPGLTLNQTRVRIELERRVVIAQMAIKSHITIVETAQPISGTEESDMILQSVSEDPFTDEKVSALVDKLTAAAISMFDAYD